MGRIPTEAVMRQGHATPGVDDGLDELIGRRASQGHEVVTHEELERWHTEDMRHARNRTSDILVDADHALWPFVIDYREDAWYWALVEMAEFAAIVLASTFVQDPVSQLSCMLLAIMGFATAVLVVQPYRAAYFNRVELVNDASQILVLVIGISHMREPRPIPPEASDVLILLLVTLNLLSLASSVFKDVLDKVDTWRKRSFWKTWHETSKRPTAPRRRTRPSVDKGKKPAPPPKPVRRSIVVPTSPEGAAGRIAKQASDAARPAVTPTGSVLPFMNGSLSPREEAILRASTAGSVSAD